MNELLPIRAELPSISYRGIYGVTNPPFQFQHEKSVVVVIDPQVGFVDLAGSLARAVGIAEMTPVVAAMERLAGFLRSLPDAVAVIAVRSEYAPGQFKRPDVASPLSHLCVPGMGSDCEFVAAIEPKNHWIIVTKCEKDAWSAPLFREFVFAALERGVNRILVTGFLTTSCIQETVRSLCGAARGAGVDVIVCADLVGARASSFDKDDRGMSRVDDAFADMRLAGADILDACRGIVGQTSD